MTSENLTEVLIALNQPGTPGYTIVTLENASISERSEESSASTNTLELETISFTYQKIVFEHVATGRFSYDDWNLER